MQTQRIRTLQKSEKLTNKRRALAKRYRFENSPKTQLLSVMPAQKAKLRLLLYPV